MKAYEKLKLLQTQIGKAKGNQVDIVSNHGEELTPEIRKEVVDVWNALDTASIAIYKAVELAKAQEG